MDLVVKFILSSIFIVISNLAISEDYYCDNSLWLDIDARAVEKQILGNGLSHQLFYGDGTYNDFDVKISINESKVKVFTAYRDSSDFSNDTTFYLEIEDETDNGEIFVATEEKNYNNGFNFTTLNFSKEEAMFILSDIGAGAVGRILYGQCNIEKPKSKGNGIW